jgi:hypothetical protein
MPEDISAEGGKKVGWFIPVAPKWNIGHPCNASFHFASIL